MRRVLTIAQMREGDRYTIERLGIPEEDLILPREQREGWRRRGAVARPVARLSAGRLLGGTVF